MLDRASLVERDNQLLPVLADVEADWPAPFEHQPLEAFVAPVRTATSDDGAALRGEVDDDAVVVDPGCLRDDIGLERELHLVRPFRTHRLYITWKVARHLREIRGEWLGEAQAKEPAELLFGELDWLRPFEHQASERRMGGGADLYRRRGARVRPGADQERCGQGDRDDAAGGRSAGGGRRCLRRNRRGGRAGLAIWAESLCTGFSFVACESARGGREPTR